MMQEYYNETAVDRYITGSTSSSSFTTIFIYDFAANFRSYLGLSALSLGIVVDNVVAIWRVIMLDGRPLINNQSIPNQINIIWPKRLYGWYRNTEQAVNPFEISVRSDGVTLIRYNVLVSFVVVHR